MFGSSKRTTTTTASMGEIETIIGKETRFKGVVKATGTIRIDGDFEGDINSEQDIIIGANSVVTAKLNARNVIISGTVKGNVQASGRLELMTGGKLYGDINANALVVGEGAVFKGSSHMSEGSTDTNIFGSDDEFSQDDAFGVPR